jgi:hypothetical protein
MAKKTIDPFHNESETLQIAELTIENRLDRVSLFGSLDITLDKEGLEKARQLKDVVDLIIAEMNSADLPDHVSLIPPDSVKNPFE